MPRIQFVQPDGTTQVVEAPIGQSIMQAAVNNLVPGIIGECGGACSCATCHLYVDERWRARLLPPDAMEQGMLEGAIEPGPLSRLSCQIEMSEALDGIVVRIPAGQV